MKNIVNLTRYALPYKKHIFLAFTGMVVQVAVAFFIPYIMQFILQNALEVRDVELIVILSIVMLVLALLGIGAGIMNTYSSQYISQHAVAELRLDLFSKIQTLSFKNIDDFKTSRLITNATNDMVRVQMFFSMLLRMVIRAPMMIAVGLVFALSTSIQLSQVFFITMPLLIISILIIMAFAYPRFRRVQRSLDDLNNTVLENANAPQVIKSFVSQPHEIDRFEKTNENYREANTSAESLMAFAEPIIFLIFNLGVALILVFGARYFGEGHPAFFTDTGVPRVPLLVAFNQYSQQILFGLMMFAMMIIFISRADVSAARINEIFHADIDLENPEDGTHPTLSGAIRFEDVSFGYGKNGNRVLKDITLTVNAGEKVGIIGSTGSGKSTLVTLIPRLYDPSKGSIYLDDYNLKDLDIPTVRAQIGFVTQQATLFSGSLATNIIQGKEDASLDEIETAAKDALIHDFAKESEAYYNHIVRAKGTNLSGGQKQRLSIARALVRKPKILILDDATSSVDLSSERKILRAINKLSYNPTLLMISQKVASVRRMDRIVVLDNDGQIDGVGTHETLIKESKVYREIAESQLDLGGEHNG